MVISKISKSTLAFLLLLLIAIVTISSCKEEDDGPNQAAIDDELIKQYVTDHQLDGKYTVNGLYYVILEDGDGNFPYSSAIIKVSYKGYFLDGKAFDEGYLSATPLNGLILGWQDGIRRIDRGGRIKLVIPSRLAYGDQTSGNVPANSVLVFDITLHDFE
jgi:FKBP-type peptidyl-prolyl cis-trans isomerase FkpA